MNQGLMAVIVVRAIIRQGNRYLLLQRTSTDNRGPCVWELPGGKVDNGQLIEEALKREVFEETGLEVEIRRMASYHNEMLDKKGEYANHLYLVFFFECFVGANQKVMISNEHQTFEWFDHERIAEISIAPLSRQALNHFHRPRN